MSPLVAIELAIERLETEKHQLIQNARESCSALLWTMAMGVDRRIAALRVASNQLTHKNSPSARSWNEGIGRCLT